MSKVSVVIRCRNEERWIGHCIQSVINRIPNNEIIVVDDSSSDESLAVARMFLHDPDLESAADSYTDIRFLRVREYTPGKALNMGISAAQCDHVIILSAHCVIQKFDLGQTLDLLETHAALFGKQNPNFLGKQITPRYLWKHFHNEREINMYSDAEDRYFLHNAAAMYKKDVLKANPFNENLVGKEDRYWAQRLIRQGCSTIYAPDIFEVEHHYTDNGKTWKGVG